MKERIIRQEKKSILSKSKTKKLMDKKFEKETEMDEKLSKAREAKTKAIH